MSGQTLNSIPRHSTWLTVGALELCADFSFHDYRYERQERRELAGGKLGAGEGLCVGASIHVHTWAQVWISFLLCTNELPFCNAFYQGVRDDTR